MKELTNASDVKRAGFERNAIYKAIEDKHGIKKTCPYCSDRCPYKKECQAENRVMREAFHDMPLEHVFIKQKAGAYIPKGGLRQSYHKNIKI